jgi:neuroligin
MLEPSSPALGSVEAYLGVPYAGAPIGRLRFMPPIAPRSWEPRDIKKVASFGPVCPQIIPDLSDEKEALRFMTVGRMNYLKKLFNFLKRDQSEDCLYLNIYTPEMKSNTYTVKMPVIVFIHGESYEWNSGNPYDGSVLASYGQVVVITLNYRLGILGFLRTGQEENQIGNFGLLDIIAALHWIQENISQFGGDPDSVTMMGHGTGASLTGLLLLSPVSQGSRNLFHRAILISGSSLSKSAVVKDSRDVMRQVAAHTSCPLSPSLPDCLRGKDVHTLMDVEIKSPMYTSPVGPYVDGTIIPKDPDVLMQKYTGSYDLMFGMTQSEAFHLFPAFTVSYGLTSTEQKNILRSLVASEFGAYGANLEQILKTIFNEYRDFQQTREDKQINLKMLLDIFSDARVVAPLVRSANLHSNNQKSSYVYVFEHSTENGYYPQQFGSIHGEDLAYIFGMPLVGGTYHFVHNYTQAERRLSEHIMSFWVNFAKTGNPGSRSFPKTGQYTNPLSWPQYDSNNRKHLVLSLDPEVGSHYRSDKMGVWNKLIPDILETSDNQKHPSVNTIYPANKYVPNIEEKDTNEKEKNNFRSEKETGVILVPKRKPDEEAGIFNENNLPVSIIVIIGLFFILINLVACTGVYYQKQKVRRREINLERKIKRMSDAGYVVDDTASHQSGLKVDSNVERETRDDNHYSTLNSAQGNGSSKRPHFQLRSNSVREPANEQSKIVLKSALKKPNASAEVLTENCKDSSCVLYNEQTFTDASYPRQAKSIPNISFTESVDSEASTKEQKLSQMRDRPHSKSSNALVNEQKRGMADLIVYDSLPTSGEIKPHSSGDKSRQNPNSSGKLTNIAASILRGNGFKKDGRPPSPIIEMVPVTSSHTPPSTYNFPSRPTSNYGEPIYTTRPPVHNRPPCPMGSPYGGIAYPVYTHTTNMPRQMYPPLPNMTPSHPHDQYISMIPHPPSQLTTPHHPGAGLHLPLHPGHHGSLPTAKRPGYDAPRHPTLPRNTWTNTSQEEHLIYGQRQPLSRVNSTDQPPPYSAPIKAPDLVPVQSVHTTCIPPPVSSSMSSPSTGSLVAPSSVPASSIPSDSNRITENAENGKERVGSDSSKHEEEDEGTNKEPPKTPVLRKVGEKTPPGTLKRDRPKSSCKSWYSQYSQGFLSKTIDTPEMDLPPLGDEDEEEESDEIESPNSERKNKQ